MERNTISNANNPNERIVKTVCTSCYCCCGVLAHVRNGQVVRLEGDPDHPNNKGDLCPKGLSGIELLYHPERLNYPMIRAGNRGEGKWQRISWNEAIDTIAKRLTEIRNRYGAEAISLANGAGLYANSGTTGYFGYLLGTPNLMSSGFICFMPAAVAARATIGYPSPILASEVTYDEVLNSKCVLLWAANPKNSVPYPLGKGIFEIKERGTKLIVVDPRPTDYAKVADIWLQIRPATDDALALGMIHVIINEELYDKSFVSEWTFGFDELKKHIQQYSPDIVADITWVPKKDIVNAARTFAQTKTSCVCQRVPLDQSCNAVQTSRAILILNTICGNLDKKGGNLLPGKVDMVTELELTSQGDKLPRNVREKRIGAKEIPLLSGPDAYLGFVHPSLWSRSVLEGKPYRTRALVTAARNQLLGDQDTKTVQKALKELEFSVTIDLFMTPTAEFSDIVLPASSWLERDGIRGHVGYFYVVNIQHRAIEPLYQRWDDNQFFIELAKKMGLDIPWKDLETYFDYRLRGKGIRFRELKKKNFIKTPKKYDRLAKGAFEFKTPSKKIELYSTFLEKYGYDPLPHYKSPPETTPEFPLILIGGKKRLEYVHSTGRQIDMLRALKPDPTIEISPKTARRNDIEDGGWVWLETISFGDTERVRFKAKLIDQLPEKVVAVEHGWWFPEKKDPRHGCFDSNINVVTTGDLYDPIYGSTNLKSIPCRIYKA